MSVTEAQTGRSSGKKTLRSTLTCSDRLFMGKSRMRTGRGSFEVCDDSNCTGNLAEISVRSCGEKISDRVETVSPTGRQRPNQLTRKLNALKQVFSVSVNCFTCVLTPDAGGSHDEGEYHAVTIFNRHTRDSVDANTVGGLSDTEMYKFGSAGHESPVEGRETVKSKTFKLLNQIFGVPKQSGNPLQLKASWRQKPKRPSPFFQERIRETNEYISKEITVLANEHADESMTPSSCPEAEVKHRRPETLTVSVDVTAMRLEIEGSNGDGGEASKTPSRGGNDMTAMAGNVGESVKAIPQSLEDSGMSQAHGRSQNVDKFVSKSAASEHPAERDDIRLYSTFSSDSFTIHRGGAAAAAESDTGPVGNKTPAGTVTDDAAAAENLHSDASDGSFYVMMVRCEQSAERQCEKRELFLLETACCVVQVAIKTALKQFKDELLDTSAHPDHYG